MESNLTRDRIVYVLMDPRFEGPFKYGNFIFSHEPFYVGKGHKARATVHVKLVTSGRSCKSHKNHKIKKLIRLGLEPLVRLIRRRTDDLEAVSVERRLIHLIGRADEGRGPLTNLTDGGEGLAGFKPKPSTVRKRRATMAAKSPEELARIRQACGEAGAKTRRSKTPEEKAQVVKKFKETLSKRSPREQARVKRTSSAALKEAWQTTWSPEKLATRERKRLATLANKSPEEKAVSSLRRSLAIKAGKAKRTDAQKAATAEKVANLWANYTPAQRQARLTKTGNAIRAARSQTSYSNPR